MPEVTNEMLLDELRHLEARVRKLAAGMDETVVLARMTARELEAGQRRINAIQGTARLLTQGRR